MALLLSVGMASFAFAPLFVRFAGDVDPLALAFIRTGTAALVLLPFWLYRKKGVAAPGTAASGTATPGTAAPDTAIPYTATHYNLRDKWTAAAAGVLLGLHFIFWILAVQNTTIASASILVTIHPVILIVIEAGFFKRLFPPLVWMGVFVAFGGSVLLGYSDAQSISFFEQALMGDLYAVVAALLFALYFLISQKLRQKSDWLNYVFRVYAAAGAACFVAALVAGSDFRVEPVAWAAGVALALGPQILGHGSLNYAVKFVAPTILATLILSEPVFATILAWIIFAEIPPFLTFPAMGIIITGIALTWSARWRWKWGRNR